jgi:aspartate racemase
MRTLGLLGGMSWESTLTYYRLINQGVAARLGGLHSARLLLASVDFDEIAMLQREARWAEAGALLGQTAAGLRLAGAQALVIATNTMHKVAPLIQEASGLPLLHIGDATGAALQAAGLRRAGLLGTRFSMEDPFLIDHLRDHHGVEATVPGPAERAEVHRIIFEELCRGRLLPASKERLSASVHALAEAGCEAVILGCTELSLLLEPQAPGWPVPLFDTTALHAQAAVAWQVAEPDEAGSAAHPGRVRPPAN